jgi:hypothetical protein
MQATSEQITTATSQDSSPNRYYQVVFIWMKTRSYSAAMPRSWSQWCARTAGASSAS